MTALKKYQLVRRDPAHLSPPERKLLLAARFSGVEVDGRGLRVAEGLRKRGLCGVSRLPSAKTYRALVWTSAKGRALL